MSDKPHDAHDPSEADDEGDFMLARRDLIKLGHEQGWLTRDQIREALPLEHMTRAELEALLFTFETLGIEVRASDAHDDGP